MSDHLPPSLLDSNLSLGQQAERLYSTLTAPAPHITQERLGVAELALEDVHPAHGGEALLLRLAAIQQDWRKEMEETLQRGGTAQQERDLARVTVDQAKDGVLDDALLVEGDTLWRETGIGAVSGDAERQKAYDLSNPLLASTLLIGDFESDSGFFFDVLRRKGVISLVSQGFISLLPVSSMAENAAQLLHFGLSFRRTYLPSSRLVIFGQPLAQLVQQVLRSLPSPSSTIQLSSSTQSTVDAFDDRVPPDWPTDVPHISTLIRWGAESAGDGSFDLSSLATSLPSAAAFTSGEIDKPATTCMILEALESPLAILLNGAKDAWERAVILDHSLGLIVHQHGGHRLSTRALATSAYLQYISCLAWDDVRIYLLGYPDTSLAEPETPQLVRWVVEAGVSTLPSWIEHAPSQHEMIELGRDKVLSVQATLQQSPEWKVLGAARFVSLCLALLIMSSFIDAKVAELQKSLEGRIDFAGQERTAELTQRILWTTGAVAFVVGFVLQSLRVSVGVFALGFVGCCAVILPSYPTFNSHPVQWLPKLDEYGEPLNEAAEAKKER